MSSFPEKDKFDRMRALTMYLQITSVLRKQLSASEKFFLAISEPHKPEAQFQFQKLDCTNIEDSLF